MQSHPHYSPAELEDLDSVAQRLDLVLKQLVSCAGEMIQRTTADLEARARELLALHELTPKLPGIVSPLTRKPYGFVGSYSINEELTHAPPGPRVIRPGDVLTIDIAASGSTSTGVYVADLSRSVCIAPEPSSRGSKLYQVAIEVVEACISQCKPGVRWSEIAADAQKYVHEQGMCIAPDYNGHGVGRSLYEWPVVTFDRHRSEYDFVLQSGMGFTIEPIIIEGTSQPQLKDLDDGWTVAEAGGRWAAYQERMVILR